MSQLGGMVSIGSAAGTLTGPLVGYLIDSYGARIVVILTGIMLAISLAILYISPDPAILTASYSMFILAFSYGQPARMSFLASSIGLKILGKGIGITSAAFSGSRIAGPALAGMLTLVASYQNIFLATSLIVLIGTAYFTAASREPAERKKASISLKNAVRSYLTIVKPNRKQRKIFILAALDRAAWTLWFPILSAHLHTTGYSESVIGILISIIHITQTTLLPTAGKLVDRIGTEINLAVSEALGGLGALLLIPAQSIEVATAAMIMIGLSLGFWIPSYNKIIAEKATSLGETYAAANTVRNLSGIPAPYIGGYIYTALAPAYTFAASAIILAALSLYIYRSREE